jgi:hypothetical protein
LRQVLLHPLRTELADVKLSTDRPDRRNMIPRKLLSEQFDRSILQRVSFVPDPATATRLDLRTTDDHHQKLVGTN